MFSAFLYCAFLLGQQQPTAAEVSTLIESSHVNVKDLAFEYEGELKWVASERVLGFPSSSFGNRFQGAYFYRADGSEAYDAYYKKLREAAPTARRRRILFAGKMVEKVQTLDADPKAQAPVPESPGTTDSMYGPQSPLGLNYMSYFRWKTDLAAAGFKFLGFEKVSSHQCMHIRIDRIPSREGRPSLYSDFWIDAERSAQPLKVEDYHAEHLVNRVEGIELQEFPLGGGKQVWLPVKAVSHGYDWQGKVYDYPLMTETIANDPIVGRAEFESRKLGIFS